MAGRADGTVRGTFDLDTRPAIRGVRDYRQEAARADEQTLRLGGSLRDAFGADQVAQIREVRSATKELGDDTRLMRQDVVAQWKGMRREIQRESAAIVSTIGVVRDRMRSLNNERVAPHVDVSGVAHALAQVELLESRLAALSGRRVSPRVGISGGFSGGGGAGLAQRRAASGGRGGGSGILSMGGIGFAGVRGRTLGAAAGLALPAGQSVIGAGGALIGSAGSGLLGAGATGLAGGGALAAGIATIVPVAKQAQQGLKDMQKATEAYANAVRRYGAASREATRADAERQRVIARNPGAAEAVRQRSAFRGAARSALRPAVGNMFGLEADVFRNARRGLPAFGRAADTTTGALRSEAGRGARFLTGKREQDDLGFFSRAFARELPTMERSLENVFRTMSNIARASMPFFHEANVWGREWTHDWRASTSDIRATRDNIRPMIEDFKDWRDLAGATFRLVKDLATAGRPEGSSMVRELTHTFDRWDHWIESNPRKTQAFFRDSVTSTKEMAAGLASAVGWLHEMADVLRPILDRFSQLVDVTSSLGLIGAPGAIGAVLGGVRGARGGRGGTLVAGGVGGRGARGGRVGGGAVGGGVGDRNIPGLYRYGGPVSQMGPKRYGAGRLLGPAGGALRGAARGYLPIAGALSALDFAATPGTAQERAQQAISSATMGLVRAPVLGAERRGRGGDDATSFLGRLNQGSSSRDIASGNAALRRRMSDVGAAATNQRNLTAGQESRLSAAGFTGERADATYLAGYNAQLRAALRERVQLYREVNREERRLRDERSRERGSRFGAQLPAAYSAFKNRGMNPTEAGRRTSTLAVEKLAGTQAAGGAEALGERALGWAKAMAKQNPAMRREVERITSAIERRFARMGRNVQIVNGDILTGTRREWSGIREALTSNAAEAARQVSADFTAIQRQAVGSLIAMGYSRGDASTLVQSIESGGTKGAGAKAFVASGGTNTGAGLQSGAVTSADVRSGNRRARGGTIGGTGLLDTVGMGNGMVAPGETWIANRHTMQDLSSATLSKFGMTAQQLIRGETRRHSAPIGGAAPEDRAARAGSQARVQGAVGGGLNLMGAKPGLAVYAQDAARYGLRVSSGRRAAGGLTNSGGISWHGSGDALDLAGAAPDMLRFGLHAAQQWGPRLEELIHSPMGFGIKNGRRVAPYAVADHYDHVHLADTDPSGAGGGARGGVGGGGGVGSINLRGVGRKQAGVPGALRQRAGDMYAAGLQKKINGVLASQGGGGSLDGFSGGGDAQSNQALGRRMMLAAGFGADQWPSLQALWQGESGWSNTARNPSSGAFGIPQSLPASKMGPKAVGGDAAAQIGWGLRYIRDRYGSPAQAYSAWQARSPHWYARGGQMKWGGAFERGGSFVTDGPTAFVAGEGTNRRERVTVGPARAGGGGGASVVLEAGAVVLQIGGDMAQEKAEAIAAAVGPIVAREIVAAFDRGTSTEVD